MADVQEPQYATLAERIAALNQQKNFQAPPPNVKAKRAPPPPPPSAAQPRSQTSPAAAYSPSLPARPGSTAAPPLLPRRTTIAAVDEADDDEIAPPLPSRSQAASAARPPVLPSRKSSQQLAPPPPRPSAQQSSGRRGSNESDISYVSAVSSLSLKQASSATSVGSGDGRLARKLPPALGQAKLPPLPPTRRELEERAKEAAANEAISQVRASAGGSRAVEPAPRPSLPPRLPSRPGRTPTAEQAAEPAPAMPPRRLPPPLASYARPKSAVAAGSRTADGTPPPVPLASRPTFAQIDAASRAPAPASAPQEACCLICRDFSTPDGVAAQYPVASLPRSDPVGYLAHHLCSPFSSATDKARAVFTWCHHNVAYDVDGFFGGCIPRGQTVDQSIFSGKAVCEGYAKIYQAIAQRGGLECVLVGGHGKGFGFHAVMPGERVPPPDPTGHAWNAVRIDDGEWKLLDACWGAGNVCDKRAERYEKKFNPTMFTMSNEKFGERHFPEDGRYFFRSDGRALPWAEYVVEKTAEQPAQLYSNAEAEGISQETMAPAARKIPVHSGDTVRFQFGKFCEHWTYEKHGGGKTPYLLMIKIFGLDGRKEDFVPMDYDGFWWWCDIAARDLGAPGQTIHCYALDTLDGRPARGVSKELFLSKKGRCGMSWVSLASWDLV